MSPRTSDAPRRARNVQGEGPNWILIAGSALLSTISVRLGFKLKQVFDAKQLDSSRRSLKENGKHANRKKSASCHLHSNACCFPQDEGGCYNHYPDEDMENLILGFVAAIILGFVSAIFFISFHFFAAHQTELRNPSEIKQHCNSQISEPEDALPLVTVPNSEFSKENNVIWSSSPDRLELPQKPFNHSNSSESPCVSESGSDIFSKREVIQKLRLQLKRRDDMILEMQDQIAELQNSLGSQVSHSSHLQSLLDSSNRDLFDSEREIQRLRKAIADHCVGNINSCDRKNPTVPIWPGDVNNGYANGYSTNSEVESSVVGSAEKGGEKVEMLKREVNELKELIEGKDYLLQSYKEQKCELAVKIKELQQRLDSQLPNIL